ncbi:lantibiotic dehydratase [Actinomadura viridis]|uniref:lantibiotic dehydratase n=1 Tax=Actinomadura viridis TaxID=58110 RepID=UPI0036C010B7
MRSPVYRASRTAVLRAAPYPQRPGRPWPDLTAETDAAINNWLKWLADVWRDEEVAEAITHASADLASQVHTVLSAFSPAPRRVRAVVTAVIRYLLRAEGRATPFGFFAGVAPAVFGSATAARWGQDHVAIALAAAPWLADVIADLESHPGLLAALPVAANSCAAVRGDRLIVPHQPSEQGTGIVEVSLRNTAPVRAAMAQARSPVRFSELAASLQSQFPGANRQAVTGMLTELVARRALITSLHAPATVPDALAHLLQQLDRVGADRIEDVVERVTALTLIHDRLKEHNRTPSSKGRAERRKLVERMNALIPEAGPGRSPLHVDLRLDAGAALPASVSDEIEHVAQLLVRLSAYPAGNRAWGAYLQRFWERYGAGSLVPVADVVADLGYPEGYPGAETSPRRPVVSRRDEVLVELAQAAALDGRTEVVLDESLVTELELSEGGLRPPPHLEVAVRVNAATAGAVDGGDFTVEVLTVSRGAGTMTGRVLPLLHDGTGSAAADLADLPAADAGTTVAQLSFPPLRPADTDLARTGQVLPTLISLAEHRAPGGRVLTAADLAIGCDGHRLYLAAPDLGTRIESVALHALNLRVHTPPLARLLIELGRAQATQVTPFDWGPAAARLPFRPRLRSGRVILAPAQWRLTAAELPARTAPWERWELEFSRWRHRRHLPRRVLLAEGDRRLPLNLDEAGHRALLRAHLAKADHVSLLEAPGPEAAGWCDGHAHELIATLTAVTPPSWPRAPQPTRARLLGRGHRRVPGLSAQLGIKVHCPARLQDLLLAEHLPVLLGRLGDPRWWFLRFRDGDGPHLRLRISMPGVAEPVDPAVFGVFAATASQWATELHQYGLARQITYATFIPEVGRWGSRRAYRLAEEVFAADTLAVCAQLRTPQRPDRLALAAAHTTAIAVAFTGGVAPGMRWLIDHLPATSPAAVPRPVFRQAVTLADPHDDWAALRATPAGAQITMAWQARAQAVASYRALLPDVEQAEGDCAGIIPDQVLRSLLHTHFLRGYGIDRPAEALCSYLTRSAALAWTAKEGHR